MWYDTEDAPAPDGRVPQARDGVTLVVAVQPPHPSNVVVVSYRVDDGFVQTVRGVRWRKQTAGDVEYHLVRFPTFWTGGRVTYSAAVTCAGRTAPDARTARTLPSSFVLATAPIAGCGAATCASMQPATMPAIGTEGRVPYSLEYLATCRVRLTERELLGETPEGIRVNWYWSGEEGIVAGPKLNANMVRAGGDWMTIRRDGVGLIDVRATLTTGDGALIGMTYQGVYDLGTDGYRSFINGQPPARAKMHTAPRFHTAHQNYLWLNRLQCIGVGEVTTTSGVTVTYDLYALR